MEAAIKLPDWSLYFKPKKRYNFLFGGRASGKSWDVGSFFVLTMAQNPDYKLLCAREIQKSIRFSSKSLIEDTIKRYGLDDEFEILSNEIRSTGGDGIITFQGLADHTAESIKSLEGFDACWYEEAQNASPYSLELLIPTIRKEGSILAFTWNPKRPDDAIEELKEQNLNDANLINVNYYDNPFLPEEMDRLAKETKERDYEKYKHIWLGQFDEKDEAVIFGGRYKVMEFEEPSEGILQGLDFGFANDPTAGVRAYVHDNKLLVSHDFSQIGLEIDHTQRAIERKIPNFSQFRTYADNARPESISYLARHGMNIKPCTKGKGSVEDGIEFIKSLDVIIHPRCTNLIHELERYSYKVDRYTGEILPSIVDEHNHCIDALRYALEPLMKQRRGFFG